MPSLPSSSGTVLGAIQHTAMNRQGSAPQEKTRKAYKYIKQGTCHKQKLWVLLGGADRLRGSEFSCQLWEHKDLGIKFQITPPLLYIIPLYFNDLHSVCHCLMFTYLSVYQRPLPPPPRRT